jgi:hypothetical protein
MRVRPVHLRTRLAFVRKIMEAMSLDGAAAAEDDLKKDQIVLRSPCAPLVFV